METNVTRRQLAFGMATIVASSAVQAQWGLSRGNASPLEAPEDVLSELCQWLM
jgi:hypothetical protein